MRTVFALIAVAATIFVALGVWRWTDKKTVEATFRHLASHQPSAPAPFNPAMIADLPDPAQRFFQFAITPRTPLYTVAEINMAGEFSLGNKEKPDYIPMRARQVLAAPYGFIWNVRAGDKVWFAGSDASDGVKSWSRFWLLGIVPVARAGNSDDHLRSAFGRYVAEAIFWTPAALLPGENVRWEAIDASSARVIQTHGGLEQAVDLTVDDEGRPLKVVFQRWSNANPAKTFQLQPFGGYLSDYRDFNGFRLPTRIEAGNFFETDDYFAFFKATVTSIRFPQRSEHEDSGRKE